MHIVLLNWAFVFIVCFGLGCWAKAGLRKVFDLPFHRLHPLHHLLLGLTLLIVACSLATFISRIHWEVNLAFTGLALAGIFIHRKEAFVEIKTWLQAALSTHLSTKIAFLLFAVIAILKAISPSEIDDEGGYHLPLIRWMENYPIIPGIANIEDRMGFNPSKYVADAFFSVPYLFKGGLYELNGFLFLLFNGWFLGSCDRLIRGKFEWFYADLVAAASTVFLWRTYLTSVDADYLNIFLGLSILILLVRKIESFSLRQADEYSVMTTLFFVLITTIKFSSVLLGLPLLVLWLPLLAQKKGRHFLAKSLSIALLILLPWLCRNYVLSGYPIYPLYFLKIGNPEWSVLPEIAKEQFEYIREYAKTAMLCSVNDYRVDNLAVHEWFPYWFKKNGGMLSGKVIFAGLPLGFGLFFFTAFSKRNRQKQQVLILTGALLLAAAAVWFFRFPALRLYWGGLLAFIFLGAGLAFRPWLENRKVFLRLGILLFLFAGLIRSTISSWVELPGAQYLLAPARVEPLKKHREILLDGHLVKVAANNQCYGASPPCLPRDYLPGLRWRGNSIYAGFKVEK